MGEWEVQSAALWLGKLLVEEMSYLGEVTGKVETLQSELNTLAAFLMEAVKTGHQDKLVQTALSEARNVAYDCQDLIETYMLQVARHGYEQYEGCQLGSALRWACLLRRATSVHKIRSQIDDLNQRISALKSNLVSYGVTARVNNNDYSAEIPGRRVHAHEREEYVVVGLEQHLEELVERLLSPTDQTVIAICGMGGLGKSTLARELYHHPKIRDGDYFQAFGWASASQRLQPHRVLRTILYSLVPENDHDRRRKIDEDIRADRAHAALYDLMRKVKCLVVVDDLWTPHDWAALEAAFPRKNATGSRIILTTRNQDILSSSAMDGDQVHLHPIKGLDETNSWELFLKIAFPAATCTDSTKETLGREMLRHCKGVPLAIVVLGEVVKRKERVEEWKQVCNDISAQIRRGGAADNPYKQVYDVLQVSYDELPSHLKHCFLHLANFPEDYDIPTKRLYHLWLSEGIILEENLSDESAEDIGERYLTELVSRNMVQADRRWVDGSITKCRLHDLMRDVCTDIAKREGFLQTVNCHTHILLSSTHRNADHLLMTCLPERDKRLRRLAVYSSTEHQETQSSSTSKSANVSRAPNLRSLMLFSVGKQGGEVCCKRFMETISEDYPLLRVFYCHEFYMTGKLPKQVGNLIHLRYLSLCGTSVTELPTCIEKLLWLQTLDLRVEKGVEELTIPNILWKMKQLRHLFLPEFKDLGALTEKGKRIIGGNLQRYSINGGGVLRLDGLSKLEILAFIDLNRVDLKGLYELERLRLLWAACATNKESLYPFLQSSSMRNLRLWAHAQILNEDPMIFSSCQVMDYLELYVEPYANFHLMHPLMLSRSLVGFSIWYLQLVEDPLPVLEKLPNLRSLRLKMCYGGQKMVCSAGGFPELVHLSFDGLSNFSQWEVEQGSLQSLKSLYIFDCPEMNIIPDVLPSSVDVHIVH